MSKSNDLVFGNANEISCKSLIESITGHLTQTDPYHLFDYFNNDYLVELKARRNNYNTYPTTMVGLNKINKARREQYKKCLFCFKFFDGLYCHLFDPEMEYIVKQTVRNTGSHLVFDLLVGSGIDQHAHAVSISVLRRQHERRKSALKAGARKNRDIHMTHQ